jgi:large subunit ribosomal protein L22
MQNNNQSVASLSSIKSSPIKLMKITRNLGGKSVSDSLRILRFSKLKMAKVVYDVLYSAMSNAENNHNLDIDNLFIKRFDVGRDFALKRFSARGRGKSNRINKIFSNLRVVLEEREIEKLDSQLDNKSNKSKGRK